MHWRCRSYFLLAGCVAYHEIKIDSDPEGAAVKVNNTFVGTTPFVLFLESPLRERVWPWVTEVTAYSPTMKAAFASRLYDARSALPASIYFQLGVKEIEIISDPPGARIEVNGDYIGDAPMKYLVQFSDDLSVWPKTTRILAYPAVDGQYLQHKLYTGGQDLPGRVLFVMSLESIDANIKIDQDLKVEGKVESKVDVKVDAKVEVK